MPVDGLPGIPLPGDRLDQLAVDLALEDEAMLLADHQELRSLGDLYVQASRNSKSAREVRVKFCRLRLALVPNLR